MENYCVFLHGNELSSVFCGFFYADIAALLYSVLFFRILVSRKYFFKLIFYN